MDINTIVLLVVGATVVLLAQFYIIKAAVGSALAEHRAAQAKALKTTRAG